MSAGQVAIVSVLVVLGATAALASPVGAVAADLGGPGAATGDATGLERVPPGATSPVQAANGSDVGLGTQISSFMQASVAGANGSVDAGMWAVAYNRSNGSARAAAVHRRTNRLERRIARLEAESRAIQAAFENGSLPRMAYLARASRVAARLDALRDAIHETDRAARATGMNDTRLSVLRREVANASANEVADAARDVPVVRRGPPDDRGPGGDGVGPPDDRPGQSDAGDSPGGNGTDPPVDRGPGDGDGNDGSEAKPGPPADTGQGNDGSDGNSDDESDDGGGGGPPDDPGGGNGGGQGQGQGQG